MDDYDPFINPTLDERIDLYHTENIVFRVSMLWDLLAQLCNVIYHTGIKPTAIYYNRYFADHVSGVKSFDIAMEINNYLKEEDDLKSDVSPWHGNHVYLNDYRNQLTH